MPPKDERKRIAKQLREKYLQPLADRGGDLEVNAPGHFFSAGITWLDANIYDHIDIELEERTGFLRWRPVRSVEEAAALVDDQIQAWLREGPPEHP